jgi:hypothetical protein
MLNNIFLLFIINLNNPTLHCNNPTFAPMPLQRPHQRGSIGKYGPTGYHQGQIKHKARWGLRVLKGVKDILIFLVSD